MRKPLILASVGSLIAVSLITVLTKEYTYSSNMNQPPVTMNDSSTTTQGVSDTIDVLANDFDPEGSPIHTRYIEFFGPRNGSAVVLNDNEIIYTPDMDFVGFDSLQYVSCDPTAECSVAWVFITVGPANSPPVIDRDSLVYLEVYEDSVLHIQVIQNTMDPDGDTLEITILEDVRNGSTIVDTDSIIYTPTMDYFGPDSLLYMVCDPAALCDTITTYINVIPINDPPIADDDSLNHFEVYEDSILHILVGDNTYEPDGDSLEISIIDHADRGTTEVKGDSIIYKPNRNYFGPDTLQYVVCDQEPLCDTITSHIIVLPINDPPVASDDFDDTDENNSIEITIATNDYDVDNEKSELSINIITDPLLGNVTVNGLILEYRPRKLRDGLDSLQYIICDSEPLCDTAWVYITIDDICDDCAILQEDDSTTIFTFDYNTNPLIDFDTAFLTRPALYGSVTIMHDSIKYVPNDNYEGEDFLTYIVCDTEPQCDTVRMCIYVLPINDAPVASDDEREIDEEIAKYISPVLNDNDVEGDPLTISILTPPTKGSISQLENRSFYFTPYYDLVGIDSVQYIVCDEEPLCDTAWIRVTINPIHEQVHCIDEDSSNYVITPLTWVPILGGTDSVYVNTLNNIEPPISGGTASLLGDTAFTYTPLPNWNGLDTVRIEICYENGHCLWANIPITVKPINDPLIAIDDHANIPENDTATLDIFQNDINPDGGPITITILTDPTNGDLGLDSTVLEYIPIDQYHGTDSLIYEACNIYGTCDTATVYFHVEFRNDQPTAPEDDIISLVDTSCITLNPLDNASDPDGDSLVLNILNIGSDDIIIAPDGTITYCPADDFLQSDTIFYTVCDTHAIPLCDTAFIALNMQCPQFNHALTHDALCPDVSFSVLGTDILDLSRYEWSFSDRLGIITEDPTIDDLKIESSKRLLLRSQRYGCLPQLDSIDIVVRNSVPPAALDIEKIECQEIPITLSVNSPSTGLSYSWYYASTNTIVGNGVDLTIPALNNSTEGNYYVIANDGFCTSIRSNNLSLQILTDLTPPLIEAGADILSCGDGIQLNATMAMDAYWSTSSAAFIADTQNPETRIFDPSIGENKFYWTKENQSCVENSIDSVSVFYYPSPSPEADSFFIELHESTAFDLKPNDEYYNLSTTIRVINTPDEVVDNGDGTVTINVDGSKESPLDFEYEVCFDECPDNCVSTVVNVHYEIPETCLVPNVITPNGDGINDYLKIDCITAYPNSQLILFNRWGDEVYNNSDYDNSWNGTREGKQLAVGTYFFLFKINDTDGTVQKGFIHLDR